MTKQKYDVFLSYARQDATATETLAHSLSEAGLKVWLDKWELVPGEPWQETLEDAIHKTSAVAVLIGPSGMGPWQQEEARAVLSSHTSDRSHLVIPVLLPGAKTKELPAFLRARSFVDLRNGMDNSREIARLVAAIESASKPTEIEQEQRIGDDLRALGDFTSAVAPYERALNFARAAYGDSHSKVADLMLRLAIVKQGIGEYTTAITLLENSLRISSSIYGDESEQVATILNNLAGLYYDQGKYVEAEALFKRVFVIYEKVLGPDHPDLAASLNNLAVLYKNEGKYVEAEALFKRALAISEKTLGTEHPSVANALENYASLLREMNKDAEADRLEARASTIRKKYPLSNSQS